MDAGTTWAQIGSSWGMAGMVWADGCNKGERVNTHTHISCHFVSMYTMYHQHTVYTHKHGAMDDLSLSLCSLAHSLLFSP